jgi:hypothetical protein
MGRYYSRIDGDLYIYVTKNDPMADLSLFPPELELFDPARPKKANEKMAIISGAAEANVGKAEIILSLNGFKKRDHPKEALEQYYDSGDDSILEVMYTGLKEEVAEDIEEASERQEMEVIIPRANSPTLGYNARDREGDKGESSAPSDEVRRSREPSPEGDGKEQGRIPASEEELIDSLVLWMRSQDIQIEKEREPIKIEPLAYAPDDTAQEKFTSEELAEMLSDALRSKTGQQPAPEAFTSEELAEMLSDALRSKTGQQPAPEAKPPRDELFRQMAAYVNSITPRPTEPERPVVHKGYSIEEELDRHIVEYVKSRTPLRPMGERREPTTWVEEELDRHIVEYIKSRTPIEGPDSWSSRRPPPDELNSLLTLLRWNEQVKPVKAEGKSQFPEELVKLLSERLKKEKSDQ